MSAGVINNTRAEQIRINAVSPVSMASGASAARAAGRSVKQETKRTKNIVDGHLTLVDDFGMMRFPCVRGFPKVYLNPAVQQYERMSISIRSHRILKCGVVCDAKRIPRINISPAVGSTHRRGIPIPRSKM